MTPMGGRLPAVKPQISDRALNGSGIWDTARVLHISPSKASKRQAVLQRIWLSWNRARPGFAFVSGKS
jgi:transposase-like protein